MTSVKRNTGVGPPPRRPTGRGSYHSWAASSWLASCCHGDVAGETRSQRTIRRWTRRSGSALPCLERRRSPTPPNFDWCHWYHWAPCNKLNWNTCRCCDARSVSWDFMHRCLFQTFKRCATRRVEWCVVIGQCHGNGTMSIYVLFSTLVLTRCAPQTPCIKSLVQQGSKTRAHVRACVGVCVFVRVRACVCACAARERRVFPQPICFHPSAEEAFQASSCV